MTCWAREEITPDEAEITSCRQTPSTTVSKEAWQLVSEKCDHHHHRPAISSQTQTPVTALRRVPPVVTAGGTVCAA